MRARIEWLLAAGWLAAAAAQSPENRGYLFVSNRLDEVLLAAAQLKRVDARANSTLVADAATLGELASRSKLGGAAKRLFDVVIASEELFPGTRTTDSMGFRLQKLRALRRTPYAKTLYLDSDTLACQSPQPLFDALDAYDAGGVAQHSTIVNGGVQVYRSNSKAFALYERWESMFSAVMATQRREQPILQEALKWAEANTQIKYGRLDRTFNCRGADTCSETTLKSGEKGRCVIIHGLETASVFYFEPRRWRRGGVNPPSTPSPRPTVHSTYGVAVASTAWSLTPSSRRQDRLQKHTGHGVAAAADADARSAPQLGVRARRQALTDAYMRPCPQLGGGHPLVVVAEAGAHGGGRRGFAEVLLERLQTLTKDNDATPCKVDRRQNRRGLDAALKKCFASKTRYAAVAVVAKLPQPPLHVRGAPVLIAWAHDPAVAAARDGAAAHLVACIHDGKPGHECAQVANRLVAWFIDGESCKGSTTKVRCAYKLADANFQVVLAESRPRTSLRVLERVLPSHFLNVAKSVPVDDADQNIERRAALKELAGDVRRFGAAKDDASALAYVSAALRDDLELYDLLAAKLDDDLRACDALIL